MRGLSPARRLRLATCVLDDLRRIYQAIRSSTRRAERELGISGAQLFVLQRLADAPAESLNQLAERTLTHQSSVSVVVQRLVARGLVARERSARDGRRTELRLTSAGRRVLRRSPPTPQTDLVDSVASMKDRDLHLTARLMHQLAKATHAARLRPEMMFAESSQTGLDDGPPPRARQRARTAEARQGKSR